MVEAVQFPTKTVNYCTVKMDESIINLVVVSWTTLFLLTRKIFPNRSFDFCNRLVSTVHAILAVILASISVQDWSSPVCPLASRSSPKQIRAMAVTLAYLIYDFVCCLFDKQVKIDNLIHHLVVVVGLVASLAYEWCDSEIIAALLLTEISSPFIHLRKILKELGCKDTDLNLTADVLFAVIFSSARMMGGAYLTFMTLSADNPILIKVINFMDFNYYRIHNFFYLTKVDFKPNLAPL
uniref:LOW QUALITY PROTEIN: transmembrane protein 136-like n=1 Tax=Nicotiana sylvestris TaxID=4096 RepID=A0A1U7XPC8_NICSY|nr:PREDICTED: LOW QUALITY PROTEIN: transmembrane protein 136-like [Nicotiana sylvestris]